MSLPPEVNSAGLQVWHEGQAPKKRGKRARHEQRKKEIRQSKWTMSDAGVRLQAFRSDGPSAVIGVEIRPGFLATVMHWTDEHCRTYMIVDRFLGEAAWAHA